MKVDASMSFAQLVEHIASQLKLEGQEIELLVGFPPAVLALDDEEPIENHLKNNESIRVQLKALSGTQKQGKPKVKRAPAPAPAPAPERRTGIVTLHSTSASSSSGTRRSSASRRIRVSAGDAAHNEEDIADHLISAASGGTGKRNKTLRTVFRRAVEHQYEAAKALARLRAALGQSYAFTSQGTTVAGEVTKVMVTFPQGLGGRGSYIDEVDLLSKALLREVIRLPLTAATSEEEEEGEAMDREVLKPINLSKASPRIFWSLVYHHGADTVQAVRALIADLDDGAFLTERKRELSDKAKENKRQAEEMAAEKQQQRKSKKRKGAAEEVLPVDEEEQQADELTAQLTKLLDMPLAELVLPDHLPHLDGMSWLQLASGDTRAQSMIPAQQMKHYIATAQNLVQGKVFQHLLGGSQKLRTVLFSLRVRSLKDILLWRGAAQGLHEGLLQVDSTLPSTPEEVQSMLTMVDRIVKAYPFLGQVGCSEEDEEDCKAHIDSLTAEQDESLWEEDWDMLEGGQRVRVSVGEGWWEDGTVVAHLAATEDEPMALWRVRLDSANASDDMEEGRFEDLEHHELHEAITRLVASSKPK